MLFEKKKEKKIEKQKKTKTLNVINKKESRNQTAGAAHQLNQVERLFSISHAMQFHSRSHPSL